MDAAFVCFFSLFLTVTVANADEEQFHVLTTSALFIYRNQSATKAKNDFMFLRFYRLATGSKYTSMWIYGVIMKKKLQYYVLLPVHMFILLLIHLQ